MAIEPLIDLSTVDLTNIVISPEQVGEMNPQAGDMRHLDYIAYVDENRQLAVGVKEVKEDEFWVRSIRFYELDDQLYQQ